jgi:SNF2 family DNA or RNA helicase
MWTRETTIRPGSAKKIRDMIKDITLCLRSEDLLDLPEIIENTIHVELPKPVRAMYEQFEAEMVVKLTEEKEVEALTAAALSMKCRQLTSGAVYDAPVLDQNGDPVGHRTWTDVHEAKLEALDDVLEEANGEPVLVVYEFKHELARMLKRYPKAPWIGGGSKDSDGCIAKWNAKKFPVMFVHAASVGHGVNLQHGGRIMVWTSMSWSYELYAQMVKRLHRQGQTDKVMIHRLVCKDTVDEVVAEVLDGKRTGQNALLAALRARLVGRSATYAPGRPSKRKTA